MTKKKSTWQSQVLNGKIRGVEKIMADFISEKGLKNSIPVAEIATAVITLSNGKRIEVTNPVMQIVELFRFVENPKNSRWRYG